jgi:phosphoenolpyruvate carboxykinase (ATP)
MQILDAGSEVRTIIELGTGETLRATIHHNLSVPTLYEEALRRNEGGLAPGGALVVDTGKHTGRSPNDKFFVKEPSSEKHINWGNTNRPFDAAKFEALYQRVLRYLEDKEVFVQDMFVVAEPRYQMPVRIVSEYAWQALFANNLFIRPSASERENFQPQFTVLDAARFEAVPERDGTRSSTFIIVNFAKRLVLIGGTWYAGEIKKSVFTLLNYLLPLQNVLSMHCSANVGQQDDVALFFGLSGTGKTTLSADPERSLIGDDETGWGADGVFNFEGGCYAKVIKLSATAEPEIYATTHMFGTVLENVVLDPATHQLDLDSEAKTENTRAAYPLDFIPNIIPAGRAGHPKHIIMLTADAFGVLPPISKLTPDQAAYHFLSGYTAKVAGTEKGVTEPQATFSTCFGAPFMVHHPSVYAKLLTEKIAQHQVTCWLVNTGWSGGPYGIGQRMSIKYTRAMVHAALNGSLNETEFNPDPVFGLAIPTSVPEVPASVLQPRQTWTDGAAYDAQAQRLAALFRDNFKQYMEYVTPQVANSGPLV